jgi:predicted molibdopterin-dependent oxidoreductase YjgC
MTTPPALSPDRVVRTTCPCCGVGCQMELHIKDDLIYRASAPFDTAPNYCNLCVKGRFGTGHTTLFADSFPRGRGNHVH